MNGQPPVDDRCTAAHELGHAFGMRACGLTPKALTVHRFMGGGSCQAKEEFIDDSLVWEYAVSLAAGLAGEMIYRDLHNISGPWGWGTGHDEELFRELDPPGSWTVAVVDARALLVGVWLEIEPLVPELAATGRLDGIPAAA